MKIWKVTFYTSIDKKYSDGVVFVYADTRKEATNKAGRKGTVSRCSRWHKSIDLLSVIN